jgi:2-polyprenyl-3-methyl-5-hydroxy-6-metoxy-1,4-benzoquinol methylase
MDKIEAIAPAGLHDKVLSLVAQMPGETVLDAPAGYGALTQQLLRMGKKVVAGDIDIDKFNREIVSADVKLLKLDLNSELLPIGDESIDIAVSVEGIEHLQAQWNLVRNLSRVLRPRGYVIVTTPNILNFQSRVRYFFEGRYEHFKRPLVVGKSWSHDLDNYHISPVSLFELQFMLESNNLVMKSVTTNRHNSKHLISVLARPLFRLIYLYKNYRDRKRDRGNHTELYQMVMSDPAYFGECLVVVAQKL